MDVLPIGNLRAEIEVCHALPAGLIAGTAAH